MSFPWEYMIGSFLFKLSFAYLVTTNFCVWLPTSDTTLMK